jgi:predicted TIM-barrel fold metal-dependent hydrolase
LGAYARLLGAGDAVGLAGLFTDDGMLLDLGRHAWSRGPIGIRFLYSGASGGYRYRPTAFTRGDSMAHVAGAVAVGSVEAPRDIAQFLMVLRQGPEGRWRIAAEMLHLGSPPPARAFTAEDLIRQLDSGGVRRAAVMSVAYWFDSPAYRVPDPAAMVAAENDWVAAQVARFPDRLVGFCSAGPLRASAAAELARCARHPQMRGVKLHLTNAAFDFRDTAHVAALRRVFAEANRGRLPVLIHLRTSSGDYGRADAEAFLREVLPAAPDVPVQIAHMGGWGAYDRATDDALGAFVDAIAAGAPATRRLYFELASAGSERSSEEMRRRLAGRIRQLGTGRVLFGSDNARAEWATFRRLVPLTADEFAAIARNVAPHLAEPSARRRGRARDGAIYIARGRCRSVANASWICSARPVCAACSGNALASSCATTEPRCAAAQRSTPTAPSSATRRSAIDGSSRARSRRRRSIAARREVENWSSAVAILVTPVSMGAVRGRGQVEVRGSRDAGRVRACASAVRPRAAGARTR